MKQRLVLPLLAAALGLATLGAPHARAQADLSFSGGLGAPLTLTLSTPVTYAITASNGSYPAPYFVFQGLGNVFSNGPSASGTITYTLDRGAAQTLNRLESGASVGSLTTTDVYVHGSAAALAVGDTVVLSAGTLTTTSDYAGAPPADGSYKTFVINFAGNKLDAVDGVAGVVPEPGTWAGGALLLGAAGLALRRRATRA